MTLQSSGQIEFSDINVELGQPASTAANIGQDQYRFLSGVATGTISLSNFYGKTWKNIKAIFGYGKGAGASPSDQSMTNLVSNMGVLATDTTGVGTARQGLAAGGYGTDKAIFGFGANAFVARSMTNLVSNTCGISGQYTHV